MIIGTKTGDIMISQYVDLMNTYRMLAKCTGELHYMRKAYEIAAKIEELQYNVA